MTEASHFENRNLKSQQELPNEKFSLPTNFAVLQSIKQFSAFQSIEQSIGSTEEHRKQSAEIYLQNLKSSDQQND